MPLLRALLLSSLALVSAHAAEAVKPSTKSELFNGKDLSGWVSHLQDNAPADGTWSVKDGLLTCTGKPNGYLRTAHAYTQYRFTVEWRFTKPGNTGVVVHMTPPEAIWPKSIECQGMHKNQGDFYFWRGATLSGGTELKDKKTGKTRGFRLGKQTDAEKPAGEWNTFTTVCDGNTVTILVNDKEVNKATGTNLTEGFIGLQSEGGAFEVRRCTLEPL